MVDVTRITINPEQAAKWLDQYKADVQRPIRRAWVNHLTKVMQEGKFEQNSTIQLRELYGEIHLVDGRHRLHSIVASGTTQSFLVVTDKVNSEQELLTCFRHINEGKTVTIADYLAAMQLDTETGLSRRQLNRLSGAVPLIADEFSNASNRMLNLETRVQLIRYYGEAAGNYFEAIAAASKALRGSLSWASCIAVGAITFEESAKVYGEEQVFTFWEGVARMLNAYDGDPRGTAVKHLMRTVPSRSNSAVQPGQEMRSVFYTSRYIAGCFNAWVEGRTAVKIVPDVGRPIVIRGSKFKG